MTWVSHFASAAESTETHVDERREQVSRYRACYQHALSAPWGFLVVFGSSCSGTLWRV